MINRHVARSCLRILTFSISCLLCIPVSQVHALDIPNGVSVLTAPEVRSLIKKKDVLFVHTLSRIEYGTQHIPGSINIPVDEMRTSSQMPQNKNTAIIFYCNGIACPYSKKASITAVKLGYKKVYWFRGGILEWRKYQYSMNVDPALKKIRVEKFSPEAFRKLAKGNVTVLDVRPKWWRKSKEQAGIIQGTDKMIPLLILDRKLDQIPKDKPILIVDRLMRQSPYAARYLIMNGYNVLGILKGGTKRWVTEGYPVLKKSDEPVILSSL